MGLVTLWYMESSQARDQTRALDYWGSPPCALLTRLEIVGEWLR